jgi:hypothetical protein
MQELEGFTYATALDLNMGYYTITLDPLVVKMCTIIFPWDKYWSLRLPMGMSDAADIFQVEMMDDGPDGSPRVCASIYIDDLLCITRGTLEDHLDKLREVLNRLRDAGLEVNAAKSFFCAHEIKYLGYMLTRRGIKPQQKEVRVILMLNPPNNVKELRHFLGMVQYYHDMWAKCSEMLAPLSDFVGECKETKAKKKLKRYLGTGTQFTK